MTIEEVIQKFNPANAGNLTDDDIAAMRLLSDDQISALAKAYPNDPHGKPYLLLFDTALADKKQVYQPSTWQNLNNLRKYSNLKKFMPYTFRSLFIVAKKAPALRSIGKPNTGQVVDLSAKAAADLLRNVTGAGTATKTAAPATAKATTKPAAKMNPVKPAVQTVDVSQKGKASGKTSAAAAAKAAAASKAVGPEDEELHDFGASVSE